MTTQICRSHHLIDDIIQCMGEFPEIMNDQFAASRIGINIPPSPRRKRRGSCVYCSRGSIHIAWARSRTTPGKCGGGATHGIPVGVPSCPCNPVAKLADVGNHIRCILSREGRSRMCPDTSRSEEHTSELQSLAYLVCRLLLEK